MGDKRRQAEISGYEPLANDADGCRLWVAYVPLMGASGAALVGVARFITGFDQCLLSVITLQKY